MLRVPTSLSASTEAALYVVIAALMAIATSWCTVVVGKTLVGAIEAHIIDGSGKSSELDEPEPSIVPTAVASTHAAVSAEPARALVPQPAAIPPAPSSDNPGHDPAAAYYRGGEGTYRTYCVRLCDGYFWPISFSTTPDRFERDAAACSAACGSPARLFVHRVPGGGPGTMVSLDGLPYKSLNSAFLFRARYDAQCRCQAQPWEQQALDRHRLYAARDAARTGNKVAAATVRDLTAKIEAERVDDTAARKLADEQASKELAALGRRVDLSPPPKKRYLARGLDATGPHATTTSTKVPAADLPEDDAGKGGWRAASGAARHWKVKVFGGN